MSVREGYMRIEISWPSPKLMPNRAIGRSWTGTYDLRQKYKAEAYTLACQALTPGCCPSDACYLIEITFHAPDRRPRDLDSLFSALKSALDGVADALGVNDVRFAQYVLARGEPIKGGRVVIGVTKLPECDSEQSQDSGD
jgi:crossover junction endodeoxyribonuclease RusA